MADDSAFDPYRKWLGIRDPERPPNHYRLLGVDLFEHDPEVLQSAADRQMAHIRNFSTGPHAEDSQRILNELAAAKVCLLDPAQRAAYDATLSPSVADTQPAESAPVWTHEPTPATPAAPEVPPKTEHAPRQDPPSPAEMPPQLYQPPETRPQSGGSNRGWIALVWMLLVLAIVSTLLLFRGRGTQPAEDDASQANNNNDTANAQAEPNGNRQVPHGEPQREPTPAPVLRELATFENGHSTSLWSLATFDGGRKLVTGGMDGKVLVWDVADRRITRTLGDLEAPVRRVVVSASGTYVAALNDQSRLTVWRLDRAEPLGRFSTGSETLVALAIPAQETALFAATESGAILRWDLPAGGTAVATTTLESSIRDLQAVAPDQLVAACGDGKLRVLGEDGQVRKTLEGHSASVQRVAVDARGELLLSGAADGEVLAWQLASGTPHRRFDGHRGPIRAVALSADGQTALSGGEDRTLRIWDVGQGTLLGQADDQIGIVMAADLSADGMNAFSTAVEPLARQWQARSSRFSPK